jgi:SAM-dependent methyltransferase
LDIGCGEGHNTRLLADREAQMAAIDIAPNFIALAQQEEATLPKGIAYQAASAIDLPYPNQAFDFATSFMCLMDLPDLNKALQEAYRVIRPGGFFQFSIEHPCFKTPHQKKLRNAAGNAYAVEVGDYFKGGAGRVEEWIFGDAPEAVKAKATPFKVLNYHRTLSIWINAILAAGFTIEAMHEPYPSDEAILQKPALKSARVVAYFLIIRCRK